MNSRLSTAVVLALAAAAAFRCSTGGGDDVAGGTGTGNPTGGGTTVVAILADTSKDTAGLLKSGSSLEHGAPIVPEDLPIPSFPITDDQKFKLTVESAVVTVQALYFVPAAGISCDTLLSAGSSLTCDSNGILLKGPFEFDLLSGVSVPTIDSFELPVADYIGLRLLLQSDSSAGDDTSGCSIRMSGQFTDSGTTHNFAIFAEANMLQTYQKYGYPATVTPDSITHFVLRLHTREWLESLNIKSCIDNGHILLGTDGELIIGPNTGVGPCVGVEAQIRANIISSGILEIY